MRAGTAVTEDTKFREQVAANGGLIISIDGIQPDIGNETMYLVRDVLTGRVLVAENVTESSTTMIKSLLAPVVALGLPVIGAISDAQDALGKAIEELWPDIPYQSCQFHYLREAVGPIAGSQHQKGDAQREEESEEDGLSCGMKKLCSR